MEMHQVRYFLAVARTLNFTRAAEECHVAQPSLTRAIRQLEGELGGDLFRRERPHAQLTDLGQRMLPLLEQCFESALSARSLAASIKKGEVGALRFALSQTIDLGLVMPHINELRKVFEDLDLKLLRGSCADVLQYLKDGEAELAMAAEIAEEWDRLDCWPLFGERFELIVHDRHHFANRGDVDIEDLRDERIVLRRHCESSSSLLEVLRTRDFSCERYHEVGSDLDMISLVEAGAGLGFIPRSFMETPSLLRLTVSGLDFRRNISLYGVAGRQRTPAAAMMMRMLRASDWSRYAVQ